jgi:hypothetical protein
MHAALGITIFNKKKILCKSISFKFILLPFLTLSLSNIPVEREPTARMMNTLFIKIKDTQRTVVFQILFLSTSKKGQMAFCLPSNLVNTLPLCFFEFASRYGYGQCCGSGMFIPDPDFYLFRIPDLGSRDPDPKTATKERGEKK